MSNEELQQQITELKEELNKLRSSSTIPFDVDRAIRDRLRFPDKLSKAPRSAITAPTGGANADAEARTAINSIITALEELGLVIEN